MTTEHGLDSNFRYVVMAARRARQLQNGSQPLIDSRSNKACRVAQEEIAAGKVTVRPSPGLRFPTRLFRTGNPARRSLNRPHSRTIIVMKVTVGVSGGIAAYKAAEVVRALQRQALDVHVVMTEAAQRFISPLTFASLTGHKVITGLWPSSPGEGDSILPSNILVRRRPPRPWSWRRRPRTYWRIGSWAGRRLPDHPVSGHPCTCHCRSSMNVNMWEHPATRANMEILEGRGVRIVPPDKGPLACGMTGSGRLAEPEAIVEVVLGQLHGRNDLAGETVLVTAAGTRKRSIRSALSAIARAEKWAMP